MVEPAFTVAAVGTKAANCGSLKRQQRPRGDTSATGVKRTAILPLSTHQLGMKKGY